MAENTIETAGKKKFNVKYCVLLPIVLLVTLFLWCVPTSFYGIDALTLSQQRVIALFAFAALMWMFEIIPNWTTSVLLIVIALLTVSNKGIGFFCTPEAGQLVSYKNIMAAFADPVVMLFLGGFVLAIMAEKYGLDVTLARFLLAPFGTKPKMVLLGFLIVISIFSMFMSNTATAAMMLAFLAPVLSVLPKDDKGKVGLALAIPIAANIGGIGTPIGTPPNATAVKFLAEAGAEVTFVDWMGRMIPYVIIMIVFAWILLQLFFPFKSKEVKLEIPKSNKKKDWRYYTVWITFVGTIILWATEQVTKINSNVVALIPLGVLTCTGSQARHVCNDSTDLHPVEVTEKQCGPTLVEVHYITNYGIATVIRLSYLRERTKELREVVDYRNIFQRRVNVLDTIFGFCVIGPYIASYTVCRIIRDDTNIVICYGAQARQ